MSRSTVLPTVPAMLLALALPAAGAAPPASHAAAPGGRAEQALIQSAMRAAPAKVGAHASVVAVQPDGSMKTIRQGANGFTCMADNPATPGPDPMCMDEAALAWGGAWMGHKPPTAGRIGLMYMLAGGTDASNTDPAAQKPGPGKHWIQTGPHVMVVGADPAFYAMYPKLADPDTSAPYVMWAGTPYEHLMVPIR